MEGWLADDAQKFVCQNAEILGYILGRECMFGSSSAAYAHRSKVDLYEKSGKLVFEKAEELRQLGTGIKDELKC